MLEERTQEKTRLSRLVTENRSQLENLVVENEVRTRQQKLLSDEVLQTVHRNESLTNQTLELRKEIAAIFARRTKTEDDHEEEMGSLRTTRLARTHAAEIAEEELRMDREEFARSCTQTEIPVSTNPRRR